MANLTIRAGKISLRKCSNSIAASFTSVNVSAQLFECEFQSGLSICITLIFLANLFNYMTCFSPVLLVIVSVSTKLMFLN